jgi:uncharacterized protein
MSEPAPLAGRGVGSRLLAAVLAIVRSRGETVVSVCSFAADYLARHPEQADRIAAR